MELPWGEIYGSLTSQRSLSQDCETLQMAIPPSVKVLHLVSVHVCSFDGLENPELSSSSKYEGNQYAENQVLRKVRPAGRWWELALVRGRWVLGGGGNFGGTTT